jgi:NADH:ubiquinone oxidoreductase subunit F (NADH-binding)/NADH:ubiquinone oxidoreductase subunit E/NAD-dependent dihydropyrimidine dehydrogenase PreA subunit
MVLNFCNSIHLDLFRVSDFEFRICHMAIDLKFVDETVDRLGREPEAVIPILQAVQDHYGYLPEEGLRRICESSRITPAAISGVASFYDMFRHKPVGKHIVRVCRGTACHVTGAERVEDALRRELKIQPREDTDAEGEFTIEDVACLGCCTLAPVVRIEDNTFGHVTSEKADGIVREFLARLKSKAKARSTEDQLQPANGRPQIKIGLGSCCMAKGSDRLFHALEESVRQSGADVLVKRVGCVGMCHRTPMIEVALPGKPSAFYAGLDPSEASNLVRRHFRARGLMRRATRAWNWALDSLLVDEVEEKVTACEMDVAQPEVGAFLDRQVHIATEQFGKIDPLDLDEYVSHGGFEALSWCLGVQGIALLNPLTRPSGTLSPSEGERDGVRGLPLVSGSMGREFGTPKSELSSCAIPAPDASTKAERIIDIIDRAGLRGRGGAGFPTGPKWRVAREQSQATKYVICNGDEGDPGAFMDRMLLESFPYRIIEGLAIAAVAVGAHEGIFYIRHEYPLAVKRVRAAIKLCQQRGWLGDRLLGTDFPLRLTIKEGAGAFVCGEETALIASIEGQRGMPRLRPPFPARQGLCGKPTVINNVETLAMVPWIIRSGPDAFAAYGTAKSKGTKVFALAGNVQRGGLIEIPMGTTIREIVQEIGGGVRPGRRFKAVQIGGPSGGCVAARLADTPVDFESLREVGAIMGSGGLVVLDDSACMVDIARYFLQFTQDQSCGKCTFCRVGTRRMLDILDRICTGKGRAGDLAELERLGQQVGAGSLCGLGKTAPNPVLTTLRYFRDEYDAHLQGRCPAGKCTALIKYRVLENCTGCTICAQSCPVEAIPMTPYACHVIDLEKCTRCDSCRQVCPEGAIEVN